MDVIEDVIPLHDIKLSIKSDRNVKSVMLVPQMQTLVYNTLDERIEIVVPEIKGHQIIEIALK